jgi:hypothetical protein
MVGSACRARAASGQAAAAPPRSVMNSRRFIRSPQLTPNDWLDGAPCLPEHVFRNMSSGTLPIAGLSKQRSPALAGLNLQGPAKARVLSAAVVLAM